MFWRKGHARTPWLIHCSKISDWVLLLCIDCEHLSDLILFELHIAAQGETRRILYDCNYSYVCMLGSLDFYHQGNPIVLGVHEKGVKCVEYLREQGK